MKWVGIGLDGMEGDGDGVGDGDGDGMRWDAMDGIIGMGRDGMGWD